MSVINIQVRRKKAANPVARIVCGNSGYKISFNFDDEWDAYEAKTARFIWGGKMADVVFTGNLCDVPVLTNTTLVEVGVYAGDLCTTTPALIACDKSILCGDGLPPDPTPEVYAQIMQLLNQSGVGNVKYVPQELTEEQQMQAQRNIGLGHYVTPQMYGAVADGVTDDTTAFEEAITHGNVYVPAGTYKIGTLTLNNTCQIVGQSKQNTLILTDGITIAATACLIKEVSIVANVKNSGSGVKFGANSSASTLCDTSVYDFNVAVDIQAISNHVVDVRAYNVTATGYFAAFAIGNPDSTYQTNGIYLDRCYAVNCGENGQDFGVKATDGYGYGYYIFGGYSLNLTKCIAEYCSGGGMYLNGSANRPLNGLNGTGLYFEGNKKAQIYVDTGYHVGNVWIAPDVFISPNNANKMEDYKRDIYIADPCFWMANADSMFASGYKSCSYVTYNRSNLITEASHRFHSLTPISALNTIHLYTDGGTSPQLTRYIKDASGKVVVSVTKEHLWSNYLFSWYAKANQVYEIKFKYRRVNNDSSTVHARVYVTTGERTLYQLYQNVAYSDEFAEATAYITFPEDRTALFAFDFGASDENTEMHYKDFVVKEVSFAKAYANTIHYPQEGFICNDLDSNKNKMYINGAWVDM